MTKITTANGYVWVDLEPVLPTPGGILHIKGEVDTHFTFLVHLHKLEPQNSKEKILRMELEVHAETNPVKNPQQVNYTECLMEKNSYDLVKIIFKGKTVATIDEIDEAN